MADVIAKLGLAVDATGAIVGLKGFGAAADTTTAKTTAMTAAVSRAKLALAGFGALALGGIFAKTIQETIAAQNAMAQLEAVVKSTGGAAGFTAQQLAEHAGALQKVTTYGDDAVQSAQSLLLTFTRIRGPEFQDATLAVLNMATAMGTDLKSAAVQVGKALNDPVLGVSALAKAGVQFSDAQKAVIKDLVETGRQAEAQRIILAELEVQFGGSAAAARDTLGGALAALSNAFGDLFEVSDKGTQGTVDGLNAITRALENTGLNMNTILSDAVRDWETMRASIEKVHRIMSLQIGPGWLTQAKAIVAEVDAELKKTLDRLNQPAKPGTIAAGVPGTSPTATVDRAAKDAAAAMERQQKEGERIFDDIMRRREEAVLDSARRQIETITDTLSDRLAGGILSGLGKASGPIGGIAAGIIGSYVKRFMTTRGGASLESAYELNDIADASKNLGPSKWQQMGGAALGGFGIGQATNSGLAGGLGGAAMGFAMAGPMGALAGGLSGLVGGLLGAAKATEAHRRALDDLQKSLAMLEAESAGNSVEVQRLQIEAQFDALRRAWMDAHNAWGRTTKEYQDYLDRLSAEEKTRIGNIQTETRELERLNRAMLNLAPGFKLARTIFDNADGVVRSGAGGAGAPKTGGDKQPIIVQVSGRELFRIMLTEGGQIAKNSVGDSSRWSELQPGMVLA